MTISRRRLLALLLILGSALATPPAWAAAVDGSPPGLQRAMAVQEQHTQALMALPGVVGTAVGVRGDGAAAVLVLAERADVGGVPQSLDGVPVMIKVTGKIYSRHHSPGHSGGPGGGGGGGEEPATDPTARFARPVPTGVSTGHPAITAGTVGARVSDGVNVYALSNNHVYADENQATLGDAVIQPGTFDGGASPADDIGTLADFQAIDFSGADNAIDAAIALSSTAALSNATPADGYGIPKRTTQAGAINLKVKKYGRTTGLTTGRISALNATVNVGYSGGVARFTGQLIIEPGSFSAGGDSGSLIVVDGKGPSRVDDRKPVGLLFAGSSFVTIANPIDAVLNRFGVAIDGE